MPKIPPERCPHARLKYFKLHYRCRDCQTWWIYPHVLDCHERMQAERNRAARLLGPNKEGSRVSVVHERSL